MDIIGDFKAGMNAALHPSSNTQNMDLGQAIGFYYKASILPAILAIIIDGIIAYLVNPSLIISTIGEIIGFLWILIPIGIIISAAVFQFFDKILLKIFKGDISKTATAVMFEEMPLLVLAFLYFLPFNSPTSFMYYIKEIFELIIGIWGIIVLTVSFKEQQNVSTGKAILAWLAPGIIIGVIVGIIAVALLASIIAVAPAI